MVEALVVICWRFFFDFSMILMADITDFFLALANLNLSFVDQTKPYSCINLRI